MNTNHVQIDSKAEGQQLTTIHLGGQQHEKRSTRKTRSKADKQALEHWSSNAIWGFRMIFINAY
jgi:hypothetical protein